MTSGYGQNWPDFSHRRDKLFAESWLAILSNRAPIAVSPACESRLRNGDGTSASIRCHIASG